MQPTRATMTCSSSLLLARATRATRAIQARSCTLTKLPLSRLSSSTTPRSSIAASSPSASSPAQCQHQDFSHPTLRVASSTVKPKWKLQRQIACTVISNRSTLTTPAPARSLMSTPEPTRPVQEPSNTSSQVLPQNLRTHQVKACLRTFEHIKSDGVFAEVNYCPCLLGAY